MSEASEVPLARRAERKYSSKLTERDVQYIRTSELPHKVLAARFGISPQAIGLVRCGKTWAHLPGAKPCRSYKRKDFRQIYPEDI